MITFPDSLCRTYAVHGFNVELTADDPAVIEAMELRFAGFTGLPTDGDPTLRFEFLSSAVSPRPHGARRPVYDTPHGSLHYFPETDVLAGALGGVFLHCAARGARAQIVAPAFGGRTLYFASHPVTTVALMEMMERVGRFSLHSGCLAEANGDGILISGPSGAGKSTLTLALAAAGMELLSDDVVFVAPSEVSSPGAPAVRAFGFADALGLGSAASRLFPQLDTLLDRIPEDGFPKRLVRSEHLLGRDPAVSCVPRVMVFPEVAADLASAIAPLDRGEALLRLVPDVLATDPEATQAHIATIAELLGQVQCYSLRSGYDLERAADMVRALL